jgi:hypothetical protein
MVVRTNGNQGTGTIQYTFSGGTAIVGQDYQPVSGTLVFATRETSKKVTVQIMNNNSTAGDRVVNLVLKNPTGSMVLGSPNNIILTIRDPNATSSSASALSSSSVAATTVGLSAAAYSVAENGGTLSITVTRTGETTAAMSLSYATSNGSGLASATSGVDYTSTSGTVSFAAGETSKSFTIPIVNNNVIEGNRSFYVTLSNAPSGVGLGVMSAPVSIVDDEVTVMGSGSLKFSTSLFTMTKSQGTATITVNHVGGVLPVSVNYSTSNGSAQAGRDYTATTGTLSFATGETSKTFTVPLLSTIVSSGELTISLTLSSPTGNVPLMDPATSTLKIYQ